MIEKKGRVIRGCILSSILALTLAWPGVTQASENAQVATADDVKSYVNIREKPATGSAIIGALRPGKAAPLVSEDEDWFAIGLSGGRTGYVSRHWTKIIEPTAGPKSGVKIYAQQVPAAPAAPVAAKPARDRSVLAQASQLMEQGRAGEAYALLSSLEVKWGGDAGFDYLYGVAALDSGHAGEAVFSLERVIRSLPGFVGARLDLARALLEVGDRERAEQEFTALLEQEPPQDVRELIVSYLDAMTAPEPKTEQPERVFFATASGGYDSNANGAADINSFQGFTLDPRSSELDSPFVEAQLGSLIRRPLKPGLDFLLRGDLKHRHNPDADFVDHSFINTTAALGFNKGENHFVTGIAAYWSALDGGYNERSAALDLGWSRAIKNNAVQLTLRAGPVEFHSTQKIRNIDRVLYTLTLRQPLQGGNGAFDWTLIGGRDRADNRASQYSNSRAGARLGATWKAKANTLNLDVGMLKIPFNGNTDFFGTDRDDEQVTASFSVEVPDKPLVGWSFVPNLRYVRNKSNVAIFDYDRLEIGVAFRVAR